MLVGTGENDMTDLVERLEGAAAGSRELDGAIHRLLFPEDLIMTDVGSVGPVMRPCKREPLSDAPHLGDLLIAEMIGVSGYSTSIDAAVALAERVLPGWFTGVQPWFHTDPDRVMFRSYLIRPDWKRWNPVDEEWFDQVHGRSAATPSLALCAAVVRVRSERKEG